MQRIPAPLPSAARWLGVGGLVIFVALAIWRVRTPSGSAFVHVALVGYGATILTFIGALHWGFAMMMPRTSRTDQWRLMGWSVIPALAGWSAMLLPVGLDIGVLLAVYWVHYGLDVHLAQSRAIPHWYLPLRTVLTLGATLSLLAVLVLTSGPVDPHFWMPQSGPPPVSAPSPGQSF
ncbi:MAG: DUF3429 domain-containing protein [Rhodocyclales bacterium]|nr:DUF3429 domain-containing protein [Rhodocyclales bacterium]